MRHRKVWWVGESKFEDFQMSAGHAISRGIHFLFSADLFVTDKVSSALPSCRSLCIGP